CRLAEGTRSGYTDQLSRLLRSRLRLAILVLLVGFTLFFLRNLFRLGPTYDHRPYWLIFIGCEIVVMLGGSALLWTRRPLSLKQLRTLELAVFGSVAAFFGWVQVDTYHDGALLRALVSGQEGLVFRLVGLSAAMRWFLLIVLYGTFIPNAWRRCAAVVGSLALLPVALMVGDSLVDRTAEPLVLAALPDPVILMATAVTIAVVR